MDGSTLAAALPRAVHLATVLFLFGCLVFQRFVSAEDGVATRFARMGAVLGLISGGVWMVTVAGEMTGSDDITSALAAVPFVAWRTSFGHIFTDRLVLLAAVPALLAWSAPWARLAAPFAAGAALALQPLLGHAGALEGGARTVLIPIEIAHLLAAGAWFGGLPVLLVSVVRLPPARAATLCERFTPVGLIAVGTIAISALPQAGELVGDVGGLFGTSYGRLVLIKGGLFALALGLAGLNRMLLTARLAHSGSAGAHWGLIGSIAAESLVLTGVIAAAAALASTPPAAHVQPVWPFDWRPSLAAWTEPEQRKALEGLTIAAVCALALIGGSLTVRRFRILAACACVIMIAPFVPSLRLLAVPSFPTSYARSTTGFSTAAIATGQALFGERCAACHDPTIGSGGTADLTAPHMWRHLDGELYWSIANGVLDPSGNALMPGFRLALSEDRIWALIDFIRARNIGEQMANTGQWSPAVPAPAMPLLCAGLAADEIADLGGRVLVVVAGVPEGLPPFDGGVTIRVARRRAPRPSQGECVAASASAWDAWGVLAGVPADRFAGYRAVVDARGWLRAWLPSDADAARVQAALLEVREHPIAGGPPIAPHRH
jgi:putative copper export protein/mono/diheme cytochrome c family protein